MTPTAIFWTGLGLALIGLEILAPGFFLLWLGIAGLGLAVITQLVDLSIFQQSVLFILLSFLSIGFYKIALEKKLPPSERPLLNKPGQQLVGQKVKLTEAILHGEGRVQIGDTYWKLRGPEAQAEQWVVLTAFDVATLTFEYQPVAP